MANKKNLRQFNFDEGKLLIKCESTLDVALRDKDQLLQIGFTNDKRLVFQSQLDAFKLIPSDVFMLGQKTFCTQQKDAARLAVEKNLRTIITIVGKFFGTTSGKYKQLGGGNIALLTDEQLLRYSRNASKTATSLLEELEPEGVTPAMIAALNAKNITFDTAINNQIMAIRQRDLITEERITKANELYRTLAKICTFGKNIWYSVNEAKYNDYIIYDAPAKNKSKAINPDFTGILAGAITCNQTNAPIAAAALAIQGTQLNAISDEYGEFSIDNIPQGKYTLIVTAAGYKPFTRLNIIIKADEQAEVNVRMERV